MKLTKDRKEALQKIAKSARLLARRCKAGTATYIGQGRCFENGKACCVFGHVLQNASPKFVVQDNLTGNDEALMTILKTEHRRVDILKTEYWRVDNQLPKELYDLTQDISDANDKAKGNKHLQQAVIKPLRELANTILKNTKPGAKIWE